MTVSPDQVDWAIAGTSSSQPVGDGVVTHGQWRHWIDSRTKEVEGVVDEGDNYPQASDDLTLEKGSMVNPATGKDTAYEELWRDIEPRTSRCVVLRFDSANDHRGLVVLLGQYCQGIARKGDDVSLERWELEDGGAWKRTVNAGSAGPGLPCSLILQGTTAKVGETIQVGGQSWEVVERVD